MEEVSLYLYVETQPYNVLEQNNIIESNCIVNKDNLVVVLNNIKEIFYAYRKRFNDTEKYDFIDISIVVKHKDNLYKLLDRISIDSSCEFEETKTYKELNNILNKTLGDV